MNRKLFVLFITCFFYTIGTFAAPKGNTATAAASVSFCGYEDRKKSNVNDFRLLNDRYDHKHLTYKITKYSKKLSNDDTKNIISLAFAAWSNVTDLTFTRKLKDFTGAVDIAISFVRGEHGDGYPFHGRGLSTILAHARHGYVHFDDSWDWSPNLRHGTNLFSVAVHEIGHALGLDHSNVRNAIMYPSYNPSNVIMRLHSDDIQGIQTLYGHHTKGKKKNSKKG